MKGEKILLFEMNKKAICSILFSQVVFELSGDQENQHFKIFFLNILKLKK